MELPLQGNKHVIVFQDFLTKWPKFLKHPCQTGNKLAVPSYARHLQKRLNTTAYHPQCDGMVEWFNRTLNHIRETQEAQGSIQNNMTSILHSQNSKIGDCVLMRLRCHCGVKGVLSTGWTTTQNPSINLAPTKVGWSYSPKHQYQRKMQPQSIPKTLLIEEIVTELGRNCYYRFISNQN